MDGYIFEKKKIKDVSMIMLFTSFLSMGYIEI